MLYISSIAKLCLCWKHGKPGHFDRDNVWHEGTTPLNVQFGTQANPLYTYLTGLPAPTTGCTRSVLWLLQGNWRESLCWHPLSMPILGLFILSLGWLDDFSIPLLERLAASINRGLEPLLHPIVALLPGWALFVAGVGLVTISFRLLDRALPQVHLEKTRFSKAPRLVYRPEAMFLLGLAITLLTMSVSISVGLLVPLSARGYVRRENIIPYILGANISSLADTLLAAALLGDPRAITIVVTHMVCAALASLLIVVLAYRPYERTISDTLAWITRRQSHFALFLGAILVIPVVLILL